MDRRDISHDYSTFSQTDSLSKSSAAAQRHQQLQETLVTPVASQ